MGFKSTLTTMLLCLAGIGTMNAQAPKEQKVLDWAKDLAERVQIDGYAQAVSLISTQAAWMTMINSTSVTTTRLR